MTRSSKSYSHVLCALIVSSVLPVALIGCSSSSSGGSVDSTVASAADSTVAVASSDASTATDSAATDATGSTDSTPASAPGSAPDTLVPAVTSISEQPGSADDDFVGAAKDVKLESCKLDGGKWVAKGTVTNDSGSDATYRIYVALNAPGTTDTKALVQSDVNVADGKTETWSAEADVATPGLTCILRVERAAA